MRVEQKRQRLELGSNYDSAAEDALGDTSDDGAEIASDWDRNTSSESGDDEDSNYMDELGDVVPDVRPRERGLSNED
jgi:hypothetical protein